MQAPRLAPLKFRDGLRHASWFEKIMQEPAGPDRAKKIVDKLEDDLNRFPFAVTEMPEEVMEAHAAFQVALATARDAIAAVIQAHSVTEQAQEADIRAGADALRAGAKPPVLQQTKAKTLEDAALVQLQAAERVVFEAHTELTETVRANWGAWRRLLVQQADEAHSRAMERFALTRADIDARRAAYQAVLSLDAQVIQRYPEALAEVTAETRRGFPIFDAAVKAYLPGGFDRDATLGVNQALDTVGTHLKQPIPWAHEWSPPDDPEHARLLATPLDPQAERVRRAAFAGHVALYCDVCGDRLPCDSPLDPDTLRPVHAVDCQGSPRNHLPGAGVFSSGHSALRVKP